MAANQTARINGTLLRWARERAGETVEALATRLKVDASIVESWEADEQRPLFKHAQKLAKLLHVPFGYLFLSAVPQDVIDLPDLRTVTGRAPRTASPEFVELLYSVILKQQWYREALLQENRAPLTFVGRFSAQSAVEAVAEDIRATLGIDDELRRGSSTWEHFLRNLVSRTETVGVLVLRSSIVGNQTRRPLSVDEFRGFAISDTLAPVVFINSRDARTAQIFTLVHEIAHIWLGASGISNPDFRRRASQQINSTERFCNAVAAEVLVPRAQFRRVWNNRESIDRNMRDLAAHFRVSTVVVLRQAYDLEMITQGQFFLYFQREQQRWNAIQNRLNDSDGGNFYASLRVRNSPALTEAIVESAQEGKLLRRDAARLLSLKVPTFEKLSARFFE